MRRLQIKFPSQIRISGWDFGSSARAMNQAGGKDALMTYENESAQAELGKGLNSTTERKTMSTKTTIKRIALVAVSALGLGMISTVAANATATERDASSITVGASVPARVGATGHVVVTFNLPSTTAADDTSTIVAKLTEAPTGSNLLALAAADNLDNTSGARLGWSTYSSSNSTYSATSSADVQLASGKYTVNQYGVLTQVDGTSTVKALLNFKPDVAGTYKILVSNGDTAYTAGNASTVITITTTGVASSLTLSSPSTTVAEGSSGALIKVVAKDADGNVTQPGADESFVITTSGSGSLSQSTLSATDFNTYGAAYFTISDTSVAADQTEVVTVKGSGGISSSVIATITIVIADITDTTSIGAKFDLDDATGYKSTSTGVLGETGDAEYFASGSSHTFTATFATAPSSTDATYYEVVVTDTDGKISGKTGASWSQVLTVAKAEKTGSIDVSAALGTSASTSFNVALTGADSGYASVAIGGGTPAADSITADQVIVAAANGSTVTLTATLEDQFGNALANQTVYVSVTGRNATTSDVSKSTDADGRVSFALIDSASSTGSSSTVTFTHATVTSATDSVTINWGTVTVGTVTVTGGATADTVAYPAAGATTKAISTAVGGAAGATTTFTATVKDANGNLLAGVPVTWTVDKATSGITKTATVDSASCYTDASGKCTTTVFSWAAPSKVTVTATAGGKTGTGYQNFVNAASDARVLSGTANGNVVTAKVVDRYGNAVAGVTVTAKTSTGYFGSGSTSTSGVTDENGEVGFAVTGGNATVTLKVDSAVYTQTDDAAGKVGTTAVTAAVAGTTTGVGASLAPAGVNSVTVETSAAVATSDAIDAANEATDAANAATDAANAAAEAADAATAAAQDAQAAVAALATQVASLIAGIKAQITTLTNLVIKIQKKVRA